VVVVVVVVVIVVVVIVIVIVMVIVIGVLCCVVLLCCCVRCVSFDNGKVLCWRSKWGRSFSERGDTKRIYINIRMDM
jgi:hypothetical protein